MWRESILCARSGNWVRGIGTSTLGLVGSSFLHGHCHKGQLFNILSDLNPWLNGNGLFFLFFHCCLRLRDTPLLTVIGQCSQEALKNGFFPTHRQTSADLRVVANTRPTTSYYLKPNPFFNQFKFSVVWVSYSFLTSSFCVVLVYGTRHFFLHIYLSGCGLPGNRNRSENQLKWWCLLQSPERTKNWWNTAKNCLESRKLRERERGFCHDNENTPSGHLEDWTSVRTAGNKGLSR